MRTALLACVLVACGGPSEPPKSPDVTRDVAPPPAPPPVAVSAPKPKAVAQPVLVEHVMPGDTARVTVHRLSNGMTVYLSPDPQEPTIVAHIAVRAGSRNDPEQSTGLAHYLEHMLFKGTTKLGTLDYAKEKPHLDRIAELYADLRKPNADRDKILKDIDGETQKTAEVAVPNELDHLYAQMGITGLNAFTNNDTTVYVCEIPKNRVEAWARVEASRFSDAVFRLFWPELEAVYEEKNISLDNPARRTNEAFMRAMFPHHGYGWSSTLGEVEHLKSPAYGDMLAFFNTYYTPQNMAIMLSGDVDESVLPILEREFGQFKRPAGDAPDPGQMPSLHGRQVVDVPVPSREGIIIGWPLVPATHPDRIPLEVMDLLLYDGRAGILKTDLLLTQKVATANSSPTFLREAGFYELSADALAGQSHDDLEKLLTALVDKLQRGEFTDADIAAAVLNADVARQRRLESNQGRMGLMQEAFVDGVEWKDMVARIDHMRAVTRADVMRVAKQYLTADRLVVRKVKGDVSPPKITKPGITPIVVDPARQTPFAKAILAMPATAIEPVAIAEGKDYTRGKLATGPVIAVKNTRNNLFSLTFAYEYGRSDDRLACFALSVMRVSGAGKKSADELNTALHALGITIDTSCDKHDSSITIAGLDQNMDAGLALLHDWLAEPSFGADAMQGTVAQAKTARANEVKEPNSIRRAQAEFAQLVADSGYLVTPSNKELDKATPAQVTKLLAGYLHMTHKTAYYGPRALGDVSTAITLGDGKTKTKPIPTLVYRGGKNVVATDKSDAVQTHVWMFWPRKPANDNDRAAGDLFGEYVQPVLYQEVREARGLAYSVFGGFTTNRKKGDPSEIYAYVGTQSDKTDDAVAALLSTLKLPIDDTRLAQAKATIEQNYRTERIAPRGIAFTVYSWEEEGESTDPRAKWTKGMLALDKAALEKWAKSAFDGPVIVSVFGNRTKLDESKLKALAPITWVPVDKLFGYDK